MGGVAFRLYLLYHYYMGIRVNNLCVSFGKFNALDNISFTTENSHITGIVGPNGAGKSTLLKSIAGLIPSVKGQVVIEDRIITDFNDAKSYISFMPEFLEIYPNLKVYDFLEFIKKSSSLSFYNDVVEHLEIYNVWNKYIGILSKGYKQRLKIIASLSMDRKYIILDEPFDGFDPLQIEKLVNFIKNDDRKFVITVHNLSYADRICDYIVILNNGSLVSNGYLLDLKNRYKKDNLEEIFIEVIKND